MSGVVPYLLDTNVCVALLRGRPHSVADELRRKRPSEVYLCSVVKLELLYGALRATPPQTAQVRALCAPFVSLPFDDEAAQVAAGIKASLAAAGNQIGPFDLLIGSIAVWRRLTLVTHNLSEFSRVPNLQLEDWESTP